MFGFIIFFAIAAAIICTVVLVIWLNRLTASRVNTAWDEDKRDFRSDGPAITEFSKESLSVDIDSMIKSHKDTEEIAKEILNAFNNELKKKTEELGETFDKKYKGVIESKDKGLKLVQQKYTRTLREKQNTETIIRSIAEGLVVVDPQGKVIMMNPTAEKLLGTSNVDMTGKPLTKDVKNSQLISMINDTAGGRDREIELISGEDETKKILRSSTAIVENENGQTVGMVSVLSDVTKQKELEGVKASFFAKVSHELRTPIITVLNSVSILIDKKLGPLNEMQTEVILTLQRSLKRLKLLIDEILDLSKLTSSKLTLKCYSCSISDIIDEAYTSLNAWAVSKGISIEKEIEPGIPQVRADSNRVIQVINNLVGNSIKFTPYKGYIRIKASYNRDEESLYLSVADNGTGIAKENLSMVFDKFQQECERSSTDITGTGLGLTIAKEIVEMHGGKIWAESKKQEGATFIFTLPLAGPADKNSSK
ncbi:MAG: ATP-binding protein [Candidatus Omnitrophota bacterium]